MNRRQASALHHSVAVPAALDEATQALAELVDVTVLDLGTLQPRKSDFHRDELKRWHVSGLITASIQVDDEDVHFTVPFSSLIGKYGVLDVDRLRSRLRQKIDEQRRIGFGNFEFSYSLHASDIPAGLTVGISDFGHESSHLMVTLRNAAGEFVYSEQFAVGPKVYWGGMLQIATGTTLEPPSTFSARCVRKAIGAHIGIHSRPETARPVPTSAIEDFNRLCKAMAKDFQIHAAIVRSRGIGVKDDTQD